MRVYVILQLFTSLNGLQHYNKDCVPLLYFIVNKAKKKCEGLFLFIDIVK